MNDKRMNRREFVHDTTLAVAGIAAGVTAVRAAEPDKSKILNYNPDMEYRRLGKTGLMVSAVCLGGHWKRVEVMKQDFDENRRQVVDRCIEVGINYIDACVGSEVLAYSKALSGRREKMYLGLSYCEREVRNKEYRNAEKLMENLNSLLAESKQDYTDLWRITMPEHSGTMTVAEVDEMMKALEKAKKQGKARFTGFSSHDRPHIKWMVENYPDQVDVVVLPFTARSKSKPADSLFETMKKCDVGSFGIKPFSSNALFKGNSAPDNPDAGEDDRRARMAIRYILATGAVTAPIPGLISPRQVDNMAMAVKERRQLDMAEARDLDKAMNEAWAKLPGDYQWLKDWEYA